MGLSKEGDELILILENQKVFNKSQLSKVFSDLKKLFTEKVINEFLGDDQFKNSKDIFYNFQRELVKKWKAFEITENDEFVVSLVFRMGYFHHLLALVTSKTMRPLLPEVSIIWMLMMAAYP